MVDPHYHARVQAFFRACNARSEPLLSACFQPEAKGAGAWLGDDAGISLPARVLRSLPLAFRGTPAAFYQAQEDVAVSWSAEGQRPSKVSRPIHGVSLFHFDQDHRIDDLRMFWDEEALETEERSDSRARFRSTVEAYYQAQNQKDWEGLMGVFADQCTYGGTLAGSRLQGKASIRAVYGAVMSRFPGIQMRPAKDFYDEREGMVHWEGEVPATDGVLRAICGVTYFRMDERGHITHLRVFWDPRTLLA